MTRGWAMMRDVENSQFTIRRLLLMVRLLGLSFSAAKWLWFDSPGDLAGAPLAIVGIAALISAAIGSILKGSELGAALCAVVGLSFVVLRLLFEIH